jgi:ribosomal-protein-alanine N-acetyltransferase
VTVRTATTTDLENVDRIEKGSFDRGRYQREVLRQLLSGGDFFTIIAEENGLAVGYATVFCRKGCHSTRIISIAVLPAFRERGIAEELLAGIENRGQEVNAHRLILEVAQTNGPAIRLYEKHGFRKICELPDYYGSESDAFYMEKILSKK